MRLIKLFAQAQQAVTTMIDDGSFDVVHDELREMVADIMKMYSLGEEAAAHLVTACLLVGGKLVPKDDVKSRALSVMQQEQLTFNAEN